MLSRVCRFSEIYRNLTEFQLLQNDVAEAGKRGLVGSDPQIYIKRVTSLIIIELESQ